MKNNPNPLQKVLYYFIYPACLYFSVSVFAVTVLANDTGNPALAPSLSAMLWFWIFSLVMAGLGNIFRADNLNMFVKIILHYAGTITAFVVIFLIAVSNYENASGAFLIVITLSILYFFIASIILLIHGAVKRAENKKERYKNQFGG